MCWEIASAVTALEIVSGVTALETVSEVTALEIASAVTALPTLHYIYIHNFNQNLYNWALLIL